MRLGMILTVFVALALHATFLLFGGLLLPKAQPDQGAQRVVSLEAGAVEERKDKPKEEKASEATEQESSDKTADEPPPDAEKIVRSLGSTESRAPALELASLTDISAALSGGGGGDFGESLGFHTGGRIDGQGRHAVAMNESTDSTFSLSEIDQKPRAIFQTAPEYPPEMRGKKIEGLVSVLFVVDASGKVSQQRVEKSTHAAFERPAIESVRRWKFEPGVKGGRRVACKMRVALRFVPN